MTDRGAKKKKHASTEERARALTGALVQMRTRDVEGMEACDWFLHVYVYELGELYDKSAKGARFDPAATAVAWPTTREIATRFGATRVAEGALARLAAVLVLAGFVADRRDPQMSVAVPATKRPIDSWNFVDALLHVRDAIIDVDKTATRLTQLVHRYTASVACGADEHFAVAWVVGPYMERMAADDARNAEKALSRGVKRAYGTVIVPDVFTVARDLRETTEQVAARYWKGVLAPAEAAERGWSMIADFFTALRFGKVPPSEIARRVKSAGAEGSKGFERIAAIKTPESDRNVIAFRLMVAELADMHELEHYRAKRRVVFDRFKAGSAAATTPTAKPAEQEEEEGAKDTPDETESESESESGSESESDGEDAAEKKGGTSNVKARSVDALLASLYQATAPAALNGCFDGEDEESGEQQQEEAPRAKPATKIKKEPAAEAEEEPSSDIDEEELKAAPPADASAATLELVARLEKTVADQMLLIEGAARRETELVARDASIKRELDEMRDALSVMNKKSEEMRLAAEKSASDAMEAAKLADTYRRTQEYENKAMVKSAIPGAMAPPPPPPPPPAPEARRLIGNIEKRAQSAAATAVKAGPEAEERRAAMEAKMDVMEKQTTKGGGGGLLFSAGDLAKAAQNMRRVKRAASRAKIDTPRIREVSAQSSLAEALKGPLARRRKDIERSDEPDDSSEWEDTKAFFHHPYMAAMLFARLAAHGHF